MRGGEGTAGAGAVAVEPGPAVVKLTRLAFTSVRAPLVMVPGQGRV